MKVNFECDFKKINGTYENEFFARETFFKSAK